jgi:outer membrane immunogenic protein
MPKSGVFQAVLLASVMALASPASAQGESVNWSGPYAGLTFGLNSSDVDVTDLDGISGGSFVFGDISGADGADVGGLLGYNLQRGTIVYGVELSLANGGSSGNTVVDTVRLDETLEWEANSTIALSARLGFTRGRALFFSSIGYSRVDATYGYLNKNDDGSVIEQDSRFNTTFDGFVIGLGAEYAVNTKTSIRAEVLRSEYSSQTQEIFPGFGNLEYAPSNTAIRVGVAFRF